MANKFTQKAENTLSAALALANELGHSYIGTEHLLVALASEKDSISSRILCAKGTDGARYVYDSAYERCVPIGDLLIDSFN